MDKKNLTIFEYELPVTVEKGKDGYIATCPLWDACFAQGDTLKRQLMKSHTLPLHWLKCTKKRDYPFL